jgi:rhodanese-related sulfurtransferase
MPGFLFSFGKNKIKKALQNGAVIIDVRTPHEFDQGKVPGSINIPVDRIQASIERIKTMKKPVVVCCASGMRSSVAKNMLKSAGIEEVYNGGSWETVLKIKNKL